MFSEYNTGASSGGGGGGAAGNTGEIRVEKLIQKHFNNLYEHGRRQQEYERRRKQAQSATTAKETGGT